MSRVLLIGLCTVSITSLGLALSAQHQASAPKPIPTASAVPPNWDSIVALPNGSSMLAPKGTVGRTLIDWLASKDPRATTFELGGRQFPAGKSVAVAGDDGRIPHLVMVLRAYPDVDMEVVGHSHVSGNAQADQALSLARATYVANEVAREGIAMSRVTARAAGSAEPLAADSPLRAGGATDDRVTLTLHRRDPS